MTKRTEEKTKRKFYQLRFKKGESSKPTKKPCTNRTQATSTRGNQSQSSSRTVRTRNVSSTVAENYDSVRFVSEKASRLFHSVLNNVDLADSRVFDFLSLNECGLDIEADFVKFGIRNFVAEESEMYPELIREFYANSKPWYGDNEEDKEIEELGLKSRVNGVDFLVTEEALNELFGLPMSGCVPRGKKEFVSEDGEVRQINTDTTRKYMLDKHGVVEVDATLLDQNDFGINWRMVHLAFTKCLQPKSHTQAPLTFQDEVMMHLLMKGREVNFAYVVLDWMVGKSLNFHNPQFAKNDRQRKESMPFGCHLTKFFKHFGVGLDGFKSVKLVDSKKVRREALKNMKIFRTKNRGYVYWPYLRDGDEMFYKVDEKRKPRPEEQIFVRKGTGPKRKLAKHQVVEESEAREGNVTDMGNESVGNARVAKLEKDVSEMRSEMKEMKELLVLTFKSLEALRTRRPVEEIPNPVMASRDMPSSSTPQEQTKTASERQVQEDLKFHLIWMS